MRATYDDFVVTLEDEMHRGLRWTPPSTVVGGQAAHDALPRWRTAGA
jgi:hypothetical protein